MIVKLGDKMPEREIRFDRLRGNMSKGQQHVKKGTNMLIVIWEINIHESS